MRIRTLSKAIQVILLAFFIVFPASAIEKVAPLDMNRVREIALMLPESTSGMGPTYKDRSLWDKLYQSGSYKKSMESADKMLAEGFPKWDQAAYSRVFTHGDTQSGKDMISMRLRSFCTLVWAECLENKGRFVPIITSYLYDIMGQETWVFPRNYSKKNCGGLIELATALYSHALSQSVYMLDDKLPESVRRDVLKELYTRAFNPLMGTFEGKNKDHGWLTSAYNWNPVCLEGVVCAAMEMIPDRMERAKFVYIGEKYVSNYMEGFKDDGYCTEGVSYYNFGMTHYIVLREKLLQDTNGRIDLFRNNSKIRNVAAFPQNIEIINGVYPSIADCGSTTMPSTVVMRYLGRTLGMDLPVSKAPLLGVTGDVTIDYMDVYQNYGAEAGVPDDYRTPLRSYFDQSGILMVRTADGSPKPFGAALKGGHNGEAHNHNDIGSYTIVSGKEKMVEDSGSIPYNSKTFGPERYTAFKSLGSYGHNVPLIGGKDQSEGAKHRAEILNTSFADGKDEIVMDLALAYDIPELKELVRDFVFDRKSLTLTVIDRFSFESEQVFESAITTRSDVRVLGKKRIELTRGDEKVLLKIKSSSRKFEVIPEEITEGKIPYTRIAIRLRPETSGALSFRYKVKK